MGVPRAFELVGKHYSPNAVDPRTIEEHKHLDLNSLMIGYIENTFKSMRLNNWKKPPDKRESVAIIIERLGSSVSQKLEEHFSKDTTTIHFDGDYTSEKEAAHKERYERFQQSVQQVEQAISKTIAVIDSVQIPDAPTSGERNRIVRCSKRATEAWKKTRQWSLDPESRNALSRALEAQGWHTHVCPGEADTCISQQQAEPVVVVSTDSDYLFRDVDVLIRKDSRDHSKFTRYNITDMLSALGLQKEAWKVVGITSGNDYAKNLEGVAIGTNYDLMSLWQPSPDDSVSRIMDSYCDAYANELLTAQQIRDQFQNAERVMGENKETFPLEQEDRRTSELDTRLEAMRTRTGQSLKAYRKSRRQKKLLAVTLAPSTTSDQDPMSEGCTSTSTATAPGPNPHPNQPSKEQGRGYKTFMPTNKFRAKAFTQKKQESTHSTPSRKRRKRKQKKKRKRPTLYNPCSRKQRMDPTLKTAEPTRTNTLQPATVIRNCLKRYATVSLNCGTLSTQLRRGLASNEVGQEDERGLIQKEVVTVVKEMVRIGTEATICAQQAISLFIARTMSEFPSLSDPDRAARRERLEHIAYFHNDQFFGNLLQDIFMWHNVGPRDGGARSATPANACIESIVNMYRDFLDESGHEVPKLQTVIDSNLTPFLQLTGRQFADTLQMHYQRNISELVERVKEHNGAWAQGENGVSVLSSIDNKGNSSDHDPISLFWILNIQLPAEKQFTFVPESGFTDQFFTITEESLLKVLLRKQANPKSFLEEFGTMTNAKKHAADHRGDLVYKLFFSKSLSYDSRVSLINPDTDIPSGHSLWDYGSDDESGDSGGGFLASGSKSEVKDSFQDIIRAAGDGSIKRKYVLTGSFSSNGYEIHVNASNLLREAPKASKKPNTTRSKLNDVLTMPPSESDHYVIVGIDPGIKSTATCCILDSANTARVENMMISQGSHTHVTKTYQKTLERAKKKAGDIQDLEATILPIQGTTWAEVGDSIEQRILSRLDVHELLRKFYGSDIFKMKAFHRKQALTATKNKGIDRVIAAARSTEVEPCFVVGDGEFGSSSETLHQDFISLLKKKANALGLPIYCADEWRTSMVCCRCKQVGTLDGRALKCECSEKDRDHNAAHNIARATVHLIQHNEWPPELTRTQQ
ncbi:MAG: hypothetical protein J3Q66DRAFT_8838 [Benniella sp.]|nr:MAG: hypothetical protein J3Q66DRAFT_8838 [Benniella sp.]